MAVEAYLPTLGAILIAAIIDSINPCAIGVMILMLSVLLTGGKSTGRMLFLGSLYIASVFLTYLLAGVGLLYGLASLPLYLTEYISISVGALIISAGVIEIKEFFWYGQGFSLHIPVRFIKPIYKMARKTTVPGIILLGVFVSAVELPCTGAPYLAVITLLSQYFDTFGFMLLIVYNLIFVLPLMVILAMVVIGVKLHALKKWKHESRGFMRLFIGFLPVAMGGILIIIDNGKINFR